MKKTILLTTLFLIPFVSFAQSKIQIVKQPLFSVSDEKDDSIEKNSSATATPTNSLLELNSKQQPIEVIAPPAHPEEQIAKKTSPAKAVSKTLAVTKVNKIIPLTEIATENHSSASVKEKKITPVMVAQNTIVAPIVENKSVQVSDNSNPSQDTLKPLDVKSETISENSLKMSDKTPAPVTEANLLRTVNNKSITSSQDFIALIQFLEQANQLATFVANPNCDNGGTLSRENSEGDNRKIVFTNCAEKKINGNLLITKSTNAIKNANFQVNGAKNQYTINFENVYISDQDALKIFEVSSAALKSTNNKDVSIQHFYMEQININGSQEIYARGVMVIDNQPLSFETQNNFKIDHSQEVTKGIINMDNKGWVSISPQKYDIWDGKNEFLVFK